RDLGELRRHVDVGGAEDDGTVGVANLAHRLAELDLRVRRLTLFRETTFDAHRYKYLTSRYSAGGRAFEDRERRAGTTARRIPRDRHHCLVKPEPPMAPNRSADRNGGSSSPAMAACPAPFVPAQRSADAPTYITI